VKWPMVKLGDFVSIKTGRLDANAADDEGLYPFFTCSRDPLRINTHAFDCDAILIAGNGDLNVKHYSGKFNAYQRTYVITSLSDKILDTRYIFYFMDKYVERLRELSIGGVIKYIKLGMLTDAEIPLPPLAEQQRIAAILDKADAIRRKRQQAIQLADDFLRAVFLDMFGDPTAQGWGWATVEEFADSAKGNMRTGPFGSDLKHSEFVDSGVAVLGIDNAVQNRFAWGKERFITTEKYEKLKRYTVKSGDVIITIMGTCGRCAVVPDDIPLAVNTKHLCCITLDRKKCLPEFLHSYFLMHPTSKEYLGIRAKGAIMDGLNLGMIKEMPIPVVPLDIQIKYVEISKSVNRSLDNLNLASQGEANLFSSLSQKAFAGEL
jgi:type I restriction enzyme, S subunit